MNAKASRQPWSSVSRWRPKAQAGTLTENDAAPWVPQNFLALPKENSALDQAAVVLVPIPYDSTTSFRTGTREGPGAIIEASYGLEDYDIELEADVSQVGIYTSPKLEPHMAGPAAMVERIKQAVAGYLDRGRDKGRIVGVLGGEHSISAASVQAHLQAYPDLSVLYLDAHADLRDEYMGTPWGHASGARRIHERCPLVLVGVRSLCQEEQIYIRAQNIPVFPWPPAVDEESLTQAIIGQLGPSVYVSVDLDVLDPALMPSVGTPEPGGMTWQQITKLLRSVAESREIVGFDVCELLPQAGPPACSYTAAKLVYKLVAYATARSVRSTEAGPSGPA
jgi:agmatinase